VRPGRIVLIVVASLLALVGFGLFAGGAALSLVAATQRDDAGYFTTSSQRYDTATNAVTSRAVDLVAESGSRWLADRDWASVRLRVDGIAADEVFVGIGSVADVERFLLDVPHDAVSHVSFGPFRVEYERRNPEGAATPQTPADADIWVASAVGSATQTVTWDLEPGRWMVVVMNADASPGVSVALDAGLRADVVVPIAIALLVGGLVLIALSVPLLVVGASGAARGGGAAPLPPPAVAAQVPSAGSAGSAVEPVRVTANLDPELRRWMWLVKWFLAIPHLIVLLILWVAFAVLTIVAFFAILFTGRYPRGIFEFNVGVLRWHWRVAFYAFSVLGTDRYPPFSLHAEDYPAELEVAYPERLSRGLVLVKWWLLAIPHFVIVGIFVGSWSSGVAEAGRTVVSGPNLVGFLAIVAGVILLFTGRYPRSIFDLLMGLNRWILRVVVYVTLMTDRYPPFRLDQGPNEPVPDQPPTRFPPPAA
jgi:hypothetical protein